MLVSKSELARNAGLSPLTIDRVEFYNTIKRVSFFSNQASNLIKLNVAGNQLTISAQDIDFSISAVEKLSCEYEGDEIEIGFKSDVALILISVPSFRNVWLITKTRSR